MATYKIKKSRYGRRRFIKGSALRNVADWMDADFHLKQKILTDSTFQVVGHKSIIEITKSANEARVLVEVVGIPKQSFETFDVPASEVYIYEHSEPASSVDFLTLEQRAQEIRGGIAHSWQETYHIVLEGQKLELHFFI